MLKRLADTPRRSSDQFEPRQKSTSAVTRTYERGSGLRVTMPVGE